MNWLITGGCGFIGTSLVKFLLREGDNAVRIVDNLSVGTRSDLRAVVPSFEEVTDAPDTDLRLSPVQLVVGDILDEQLAVRAATGVDVVVHLAANTGVQPSIDNPRRDCLTNVLGTLNYLEAARLQRVQRFVFASSGGTVIGDCEPPIHEEMVPHPKSPYGASKSACEGYLSAYHSTFGMATLALRFGNVYGPGSSHKNSVVAQFIRRALDGEPLQIYGDGHQTRDFIYIEDLVAAIDRAAHAQGLGGETIQIASSQETSVKELAVLLVACLEEAGLQHIRLENSHPLPGEIRRNYSDTAKANKLLGWQPSTRLTEGLRKTVAWFRESVEVTPYCSNSRSLTTRT